MTNPGKTTWILLAGFGALLLIVLIATRWRAGDQDRLDGDPAAVLPETQASADGCAGNVVVSALKTTLFAEAAKGRPGDADAIREVGASAVLRMENEAVENEEDDRLDCSATVAIDLPPGIAASGGRSNLMGSVDYSVFRRTGDIAIRNGSALITALSGLQRAAGGIAAPLDDGGVAVPTNDLLADDTLAEPMAPLPPVAVPQPPRQPAQPPRAAPSPPPGCARARSRAEQIMCADPRLFAFDREMASRTQAALTRATPAQRNLLRETEFRFLFARDRCRDSECIIRAYQGRFAEIADIMAMR